MKFSGYPDTGDLVVGEINEIEDFGVFVDLEEYESKRGLVHVSEVASGWIKNLRDHVNTGQIVVCKVHDVNESAEQIDLSIKDVNDHQRSDKIQEWKAEQKAEKWMELAFGDALTDEKYSEIANAFLSEFGTLYDGFEQAAIHGPEAFESTALADEDIAALVDTARDNVSVPYVNVTGYVDLRATGPSGVNDIRTALQAAEGNGEVPDEVNLEVTYVGAPEYRVRVQAPNYKTAESELEHSVARASDAIETVGGSVEFHRERRSDDE
jgi:translation initiation factor 2 subunit 1